jgi:iron complex transport system permease protein
MIVRDYSGRLAILLTLAILLALVGSVSFGSVALPLHDIAQAFAGKATQEVSVIIWEIRLPRALAALVVGGALGASGAALQGLLRNPLAEPGVLGVSASASLCATIAIFWGLTALSPWVLPGAAIAGAIVATFILAALAPRMGSVVTLILIGVGLSAVTGALMMLLLNLAPNPFSLADMINWTMGSVANRSLVDLGFAAPFWIVGFGVLLGVRHQLVTLGFGEETAQALGVDTTRLRAWVVLGAGLMTGAGVSLAGAIGFVGLIAPHLVRPFVGHDPGRALIPSALLGGLLLMIADVISRLIQTQQELKLGVIVAFIGAPLFVAIVMHRPNGSELI